MNQKHSIKKQNTNHKTIMRSALIAILLITTTFSAFITHATIPDEPERIAEPFCQCAYDWVYYHPGSQKDGNPINEDRRNPDNALGPPQYDDTINFVTLGFGGILILEFAHPIMNGDDWDFEIIETSFGNPPCEQYQEEISVYASVDNKTWEHLGTTCLDGLAPDTAPSQFDLGTLEWARYIKIVDISNPEAFSRPTDDGYDVDGVNVRYCQDEFPEITKTITINATKIICNCEDCLPNWGGLPDQPHMITSSLLQDFLDENPYCQKVDDWEFEWGIDGEVSDPTNYNDDQTGKGGGNWHTFSGKITITVPESTNKIWIREVLKPGYIPFAGKTPDDNESAELYAHDDIYKYDNYDSIDNIKDKETYYIVAFNAPIGEPCEDNDPDCDPEILLPDGPITMYAWKEPINYPSIFKNMFEDNIDGSDINNGLYQAYCVDYGTPIDLGYGNPHKVTLYSSYHPPEHLDNNNWQYINYILNHKQGDRYDVQRAIFYFINFGPWEWDKIATIDKEVTQETWNMINQALEHADDWCPACPDVIAVICDPGIEHEFQITIIEVPLCDIDTDQDGVMDHQDNCPETYNPDQTDNDNDNIGDVCDPDDDNDGIFDEYEEGQDSDDDGIPDDKDPDDDNDGIDTSDENADPNNDGNPEDAKDSDDDGIPDYLDDTDDSNDEDDTDDDSTPSEPRIVKRTSSSSSAIINPRPVAIILEPYEFSIDDQPIILNGTKSYDPNGFITGYRWNTGDGTIQQGDIITHAYANPGTFYVTLEVTDNQGTHGTSSQLISIYQPNRAPQDPIIGGYLKITVNKAYSYAATSDDLDNDDIRYIFDWGDGTSDESEFIGLPLGSAYNMIHTWKEPGKYTLTVTVTDGEYSSTATATIEVQEQFPVTGAMGVSLLIIAIVAGSMIIYFYIHKKREKGKETPKV